PSFLTLRDLTVPLPIRSSPLILVRRRRPPISTLFPYTTLFRSVVAHQGGELLGQADSGADVLAQPAGAVPAQHRPQLQRAEPAPDRKSTRLNSSHVKISYAVFCLKKKRSKKPQ